MTGPFLTVECPGCGKTSSQVPLHLAGRSLRCAACGRTFTVPEPPPMPTAREDGAVAPTVAEAGRGSAVAAAPAGISWQPGDVVLGLYQVVGVLGEGGMGRVYRVRHPGWGMDLAVKVPLPDAILAAGGPDLFEGEAEAWVKLGLHPHVVTCYYVRRLEGLPLVFAELVEGETLLAAIRDGRLASLEEILDVAVQFAWGLHYAHEQGLVHRDVKPANVLLGAGVLAKVTDFGLARGRIAKGRRSPLHAGDDAGAGRTMTVEGGGGGTPAYFSPEQARGDTLTRRTDLWSFALSVLEAFLGERTWKSGLAAPEVLEGYRRSGAETPGLPKMPDAVADFLGQCFREKPEERPHGMGEAAAVLIQAWEQAAGRSYPRSKPRGSLAAADSLNNRAVSLVDLGRDAEAMTLWRRALEAEPQHLEATYNASAAGWAEGRLDDEEVLRRMRDACASHARQPRAQQLLGRLHHTLYRPAEALACFERAAGVDAAENLAADVAAARVSPPGPLLTLRGLSGAVSALAVSPDARSVAAASGAEVRVWDAGRGGLLRTLHIPDGAVRSMTFLPDGRLLVGAERASLTPWEISSGRAGQPWARHVGFTTCLVWMAGGRLLVSGGSDRVVRFHDAGTGRCLREMEGHEEAVTSVAGGTTRFASASRDGTVRLWTIEDARCLAVLRGHSGHVHAVALDEPASRLVSAGDDGAVRDWGLNSHEMVRAYFSHTRPVHCLALAGGSRLFTGSADGTARAWDCVGERLVGLARLDGGPVQALVAGSDGRVWAAHGSSVSALAPPTLRSAAVALCRPSSAVEVEERAKSFDQQIEEARRKLAARDFTTALSLARSARAIPGHERAELALSVWDDLCSRLPRKGLQSAWEEARLEGHPDQVLGVAVDATGRWAVTGGFDSTARVWQLASRRATAVLSGHAGPVMAVAIGGEPARAVSGGRDRTVRIWDVATGRPLRTLEGHEESVSGVDLSPDGSTAASASWDGTVMLWDLARGAVARVLGGHEANVSAVRFSADGRALASGGWDGAVRLWHAESGEPLCALAGHKGNVTAVAFHPTGRQVASGGEDGSVRLWDPKTRRALRVLTDHEGEITAVAFSPDGRFLFSSSRDHTVRIWDARRGVCVRTLLHPAAVLDVAPLPLASRLLSAGADRAARLWHLDWEPEPAEAAPANQTARPFLETLVSRRNSPTSAPARAAPARAWSEAEVDLLLADLHHRGFGTLTRESVTTELRTLTASPRATSWDELRASATEKVLAVPREAPSRRTPWGRLAASLLVLVTLVIGFLSWYKPKPRLRLSSLARQLEDPDIIDTAQFGHGCDAGDFEVHMERFVSGHPAAEDVACLAATGSSDTVDAVLDGAPLQDPDPTQSTRLRRNVVSVLVGLGPAAVDALCQRLDDPRPDVRWMAGASLGFSAAAPAVACESRAISSGTPEARAAAGTALRMQIARGRLPLQPAWNVVGGLLGARRPEARATGVSLLTLFTPDLAEATARPLLDDTEPVVRDAAQKALGDIESVRKLELLVRGGY